jgi:hypothetical protein
VFNWQREGRFVYWQMYLSVSVTGGGGGTLLIETLPFAAVVTSTFDYGPAVRCDLGAVTSDALVFPRYFNAQSYIALVGTKAGGLAGANVSAANVVTAGGFTFIGQGMYRIS